MDRFVYNDEFNRDVIYEKLADISSKLEEEQEKSNEERDITRERDLIYAQMIQGLKLNTLQNNRNLYCPESYHIIKRNIINITLNITSKINLNMIEIKAFF